MKTRWHVWLLWIGEAENRIILTAVILGTAITWLLAGLLAVAGGEQKQLSEQVLRFHVLASSDSEEDQALKLQVRDAVIAYLEPCLRQSESVEETRAFIATHLPQITDVASRSLQRAGSSENVQVMLGVSDFPTKYYGSVALPAGRYETLRIEIGQAQGQNWWCVMFPSLCFVDETQPDAMDAQLEENLPEAQNDLIHEPRSFRFKLIEWYHALFD